MRGQKSQFSTHLDPSPRQANMINRRVLNNVISIRQSQFTIYIKISFIVILVIENMFVKVKTQINGDNRLNLKIGR